MNKFVMLIATLLVACGASPSHPEPLVHRFRSAEEWAKVFDAPARDAWQKPDAVVALMTIEPAMTVVDLGAGTGYFEPYVSRAVGEKGRVLALDVEPDMIRYLKERAAREKWTNVEPRLVATDDPKLEDGSVDRILIVDTWHHVPARVDYAKKMRRALRAKGMVVIVDFTMESKQGPPKEHRLAPESVRDELISAGFSTEITNEDLPDQYVVLGAVP